MKYFTIGKNEEIDDAEFRSEYEEICMYVNYRHSSLLMYNEAVAITTLKCA